MYTLMLSDIFMVCETLFFVLLIAYAFYKHEKERKNNEQEKI
jgi:cbb3-type cytochrome oxidase subunit 3